MRDVDGWHWLHKDCPVFWIADQGKWDWGNDEFLAPEHVPASYHYIGPVTPPATVAALVEALEWFIDNDDTNEGDTPLPGHGGRTWNEINAYWIDGLNRARAALALHRGEVGR